LVPEPFGYPVQDLPGVRSDDVIAVPLAADVIFFEIYRTLEASTDLNKIGERRWDG
jgi:hypothetical protein